LTKEKKRVLRLKEPLTKRIKTLLQKYGLYLVVILLFSSVAVIFFIGYDEGVRYASEHSYTYSGVLTDFRTSESDMQFIFEDKIFTFGRGDNLWPADIVVEIGNIYKIYYYQPQENSAFYLTKVERID